jgi:xanthine dehydrogenase YagR molybdenum-binding subunit
MTTIRTSAIGAPLARLDGRAKVTGTAPYAFEHAVDRPTLLHPVQAAIARGRVTVMDTADAERLDGVVCVLTVFDAPELIDTSDGEFAILQDDRVHFRGQVSQGAGEIGIVGAAAAVVNAVFHATGVRVRDLPVACDKVL